MKINLQLFAYKSGYNDEKKTLELINDGSVAKPQTLIQDVNAVNTPITYTAKAGTPPKGVSEEDWNTMHSTFTEGGNTTALGNEKNNAYGSFKDVASNTNIIDQKTKDALNATFSKPASVLQAESFLSDTLGKIQSGRTSYTDDVEAMMYKIMNRDKFEYDVDSDQLFQQALASAMNSGQTAMQDTIGQASALTGGYGSTYATSAGNQAYNAFIEDAYNNLPEYYQMALQAYQMEGEEMYRQLGMFSDADDREFGRTVDAFNATSQYRNQAYNEAYTLYQDGINNAYNSANLQLNENAQLVNNAYNIYNAASNEYEKSYAKDYDNWNVMVQQAVTNAGFANSDWWNQSNQDFQASESQKNRDFQASEAEKDRAFQASENAKNRAVKNTGGGGITSNIPSDIAKKAASIKNDGERFEYISGMVDAGYLTDEQADYLVDTNKSPEQVPLTERTWTMTDNGGKNFFWGVDGNGAAVDQYGNPYTMDELYDELKKTMGKDAAKKYVVELQNKIGITNYQW